MDLETTEYAGNVQRGVIVEYDFTAITGEETLFETAKSVLAEEGIELNIKLEALCLAGGNCQGGLIELFRRLDRPSGEAASLARKLSDAFRAAITERLEEGMTDGFKAFLRRLTDRGLKVVLSTRGDAGKLRDLLDAAGFEQVVAYAEASNTYGSLKWDAWARALNANDLHNIITVAVTGSGYGVKAALVAGMPAMATVHPHVAYQDFGGADLTVEQLDEEAAGEALRVLHY